MIALLIRYALRQWAYQTHAVTITSSVSDCALVCLGLRLVFEASFTVAKAMGPCEIDSYSLSQNHLLFSSFWCLNGSLFREARRVSWVD